jgi:hypothetical protein
LVTSTRKSPRKRENNSTPPDPHWQSRQDVYLALIEQVGLTVRVVVIGAVLLGVAYFAKESFVESVRELAGRETKSNIAVEFINHVEVSITLAWMWAAGATLYGLKERQLRKRTIKHMQQHKRALEDSIDPKRSSSELDEDGSNNPGDES